MYIDPELKEQLEALSLDEAREVIALLEGKLNPVEDLRKRRLRFMGSWASSLKVHSDFDAPIPGMEEYN